jgi:hypothetical protein
MVAMQEFGEAMHIALRVLGAWTERAAPNEHDVEILRRHAPLFADAPVDELAREVIQEALHRRAEA